MLKTAKGYNSNLYKMKGIKRYILIGWFRFVRTGLSKSCYMGSYQKVKKPDQIYHHRWRTEVVPLHKLLIPLTLLSLLTLLTQWNI